MGMMLEPSRQVDHWVIGFNWLIDRKATQALLTAVHQAVDLKARKITLCLSSPGGAPDQAFYAYEILVALQSQVELITHNVSTVQSAAMMLFLAGSKRYAVPNSTFLVHKTTHDTGGSVTVDHVTKGIESIKADDQAAMAILAARTGTDLRTVRTWFAGQKLRDTNFAQRASIISEVAAVQLSASSRFHQIIL
jgi:ATP-dependent Clp protease, protease subunit